MATPVRLEEVGTANTLTAVTGNSTGSTFDPGKNVSVVTIVCGGTSTLAGTLTIEFSLDGTNWMSTGTTVALTAGARVTATATGKAMRFVRCSLSGASGTGTATCTIAAVS